jgi:hypothetical protein
VAPDDDPDFLKSLDRYRDPRTTVKPPDPEDTPEPKDSKGSDESSSETDDGNPER